MKVFSALPDGFAYIFQAEQAIYCYDFLSGIASWHLYGRQPQLLLIFEKRWAHLISGVHRFLLIQYLRKGL